MFVKKKKHKSSFHLTIFFIVSTTFSLSSQSLADTVRIEKVFISSNRLSNFSTGVKTQKFDSLTLARYAAGNFGDLLSNEGGLTIKSYGLGSLATSSIRGSSASQVAAVWNGFNINNSMNGQLDLSLIPVSFSNNVNIQFGGDGALWGSGMVGGAIHLSSDLYFNKGISAIISFNGGSFQNYSEQIALEISKKKWCSSVKLLNGSAKNNFYFYNSFMVDTPKVQQKNAERQWKGILFENAILLNQKQKLLFAFWYQNSNCNIAPTMLQSTSNNNQNDINYRCSTEWQRKSIKTYTFLRAGYFEDHLLYNTNLSKTINFTGEAEWKIKWNIINLTNIGVNNSYAQGFSPAYLNTANQKKQALFVSHKFSRKRINVKISLREELLNLSPTPLTYSTGADYNLRKWISLKANFSKVYRFPTLNDLYWVPGGNPNLKAEDGFCEDVGVNLNLHSKNKKTKFQFEPALFNRNINNWIIWLPQGAFWSPQNIMKVWSRGLETNSKVIVHRSKFYGEISVLTNYVLSTNETSKVEGDASVGKQLIYVPIYSGYTKWLVEYKGFVISYLHSYTGYRYTSTDHSQYLTPYYLANVYLAKKINFQASSLSLFFKIDNLFNQSYQVMLSRAMPLRYYSFGLTYQINKPNKK